MDFNKRKGLRPFHFILILLFFIYVPSQVNAQDILKDTLIEEAAPIEVTVQEERAITGGLQLEAFAVAGFVHIGRNPVLKLGASYKYGNNLTNLILVAGESFSRPRTINYDKTEGEKRFYFETRDFSLYTNIRCNKSIDVSIGYKLTKVAVGHYYNEDGHGVKAKFKGFFLQPSFGKGNFQYAFRIMAGNIIIDEINSRKPRITEFGILLQPLIVTIYFGKSR